MNTRLPITPWRQRSPLAIDKPTLLTLIAVSLLFVETFSGALRYYADMAGVPWVTYLPKIACLLAVALEMPSYKGRPEIWLTLLGLLTAAQLALLHGATLPNIAFSLFVYAPLLFGLVCGSHIEQRLPLLCRAIGLCLIASLIGVALDLFTQVPWKGYSYMLGDTELSGNKAWGSGGIDRLAGFSRDSTTLAVMIALFSLFMAAFIRSRLLRLLLYVAAITGIVLSTNKSTAAAYVLTLVMLFSAAYRLPSATAFLLVTLAGLALPVASLMLNIPQSEAYSEGMLASFNDRLIHSWPNFIQVVVDQGWAWWGAGFGVVGSTAAAFPITGVELLFIADNTALYLWGMLGGFGVLLYLLLFPLMLRLHERGARIRHALLGMVFCVTLIGWATDVLEVVSTTLFLGLAIAHVTSPLRAAAKARDILLQPGASRLMRPDDSHGYPR